MSAEIEITDGRANVLGRETWWHRLNEGLGRNATWQDVRELTPVLAMAVTKKPLQALVLDPDIIVPSDMFVTVRDDNKVLGAVGDKYDALSPEPIFEWGLAMAQTILGTDRDDLLISAVSIREGRQGAFVFEGDSFEVGGVEFSGNLNIPFSHDGTVPVRMIPGRECIVCANTFDSALRSSSAMVFRHTARQDERMAQALAAQKLAAQETDSFVETVSKLQLRKVSGSDLDTWVTEMFPLGTEQAPVSTRTENQNTEARDAIYNLFNAPLNDGVEGTGWAFVQAVNSYENWNAPIRKTKGLGSETTRAIRQFDGLLKGQPMTAKATAMALS